MLNIFTYTLMDGNDTLKLTCEYVDDDVNEPYLIVNLYFTDNDVNTPLRAGRAFDVGDVGRGAVDILEWLNETTKDFTGKEVVFDDEVWDLITFNF